VHRIAPRRLETICALADAALNAGIFVFRGRAALVGTAFAH
jgi:hypothetical protein